MSFWFQSTQLLGLRISGPQGKSVGSSFQHLFGLQAPIQKQGPVVPSIAHTEQEKVPRPKTLDNADIEMIILLLFLTCEVLGDLPRGHAVSQHQS